LLLRALPARDLPPRPLVRLHGAQGPGDAPPGRQLAPLPAGSAAVTRRAARPAAWASTCSVSCPVRCEEDIDWAPNPGSARPAVRDSRGWRRPRGLGPVPPVVRWRAGIAPARPVTIT